MALPNSHVSGGREAPGGAGRRGQGFQPSQPGRSSLSVFSASGNAKFSCGGCSSSAAAKSRVLNRPPDRLSKCHQAFACTLIPIFICHSYLNPAVFGFVDKPDKRSWSEEQSSNIPHVIPPEIFFVCSSFVHEGVTWGRVKAYSGALLYH